MVSAAFKVVVKLLNWLEGSFFHPSAVIHLFCLIQEFNKVPMFMKTAPEEIDPQTYPELACLQAIIHDEDRPPEGNYVRWTSSF